MTAWKREVGKKINGLMDVSMSKCFIDIASISYLFQLHFKALLVRIMKRVLKKASTF